MGKLAFSAILHTLQVCTRLSYSGADFLEINDFCKMHYVNLFY